MEVTTARRTKRPAGLDARTLAEAFQLTAATHPERVALRLQDDELSLTWGELAEKVRRVAAGLAGLGLSRGQAMGIMLTNRPDFHWFDAAALHLGATPFSIYNTYAPEQIQFQVEDADARIVVTEKAFEDRIRALKGVDHVIVVDGGDDVERHAAEGFDFDASWRAVEPEDVLTLIYTSGTTGPPKGVQLTHTNLMAQWRAVDAGMPRQGGGRVVSYLPAAHVADRVVTHYRSLVYGAQITCCPDPREVVAHLPDARPSWFFAVPRIFEKLQAAIEAGIESEQDEERKRTTLWALDVALRKV